MRRDQCFAGLSHRIAYGLTGSWLCRPGTASQRFPTSGHDTAGCLVQWACNPPVSRCLPDRGNCEKKEKILNYVNDGWFDERRAFKGRTVRWKESLFQSEQQSIKYSFLMLKYLFLIFIRTTALISGWFIQVTYYLAQSISWYSLDRSKQACTPRSCHKISVYS